MIHPYSHYPARAARHWPDHIALVDGDETRTYAELDVRASGIALSLQNAGLEVGERVAVLQHNCIAYVESVIGIARAGGVLVPLLGALTPREHSYILADSGARFAIALTSAGVAALRSASDEGLTLLAFAGGEGVIDLSPKEAPQGSLTLVDRPPSQIAQILYTSGTTGQPKGVTHSYASVSAAMNFWAQKFDLGTEDRLLGQLALSHFCGRAMDSCWVAGARLVILPEADPAAILETIDEQNITMMLVVPTLLRMLLDHEDAVKRDLGSLRAVVYAASPAAPSLVERACDRLGEVLYTGFGQTEAYGLNTFMGPREHQQALTEGGHRLTSVGRECAVAQVRIRSEDGEDVATGEVGEIWVSAPWATPGFWQRPDLDEQRLTNGWLRTGDLGRMDESGYIYLADRREDMIITGGFNVYPAEIENCLVAHPAVVECGAFSVPDAKWGEAVNASVVLREGMLVGEEELLAFAKANLARFKVPKSIHVMEELPKTAVGKILRRSLRAPFWEGQMRDVHGVQ
ncbi:MAG: AMP-binding protein [Pseudomonadales bacterium]|jgi:acyl-CoA synthetase (AMP-forming)/AMP-acid ligase II|nr:AMP-binding protein [Pseudomonadales bacterium]MDP6470305.1 AMP-binding protein [Pseudomonadales bacterium]MDP6827211.1 AMP-binding protein [Pseudomonadales bacterium]MDP6972487.1 AMP-binding protein [Pseudomonadales bacterium]|tara:strand:+ start:607 stop:2160 length:1554 start_codon:yes stop_codon:yes gene_type:complete